MNILTVAENERERRQITELLESRGHNVVTVPTMQEGLVVAAKTTPDCIVLESGASTESRSQFQRVLSAGARHDQTPVIVANPQENWQHVVEVIAKLWELDTGRATLRSWSPLDAASGGLTAVVLDSTPRGTELARSLAHRELRVLETSDIRRATLAILDQRVDCVLVSSTVGGGAPHSVVRSLSILRKTHPHPFAILVLVDEETSTARDEAVAAGADGIGARSIDASSLRWRVNAAVTAFRVKAGTREGTTSTDTPSKPGEEPER
jgi:DNA-binding response OmpR family regulator